MFYSDERGTTVCLVGKVRLNKYNQEEESIIWKHGLREEGGRK